MRFVFYSLLFFFLCPHSVQTQDLSAKTAKVPWLFLGAYGHINTNLYNPNFSSFPNIFSCNSLYTTGSGSGVDLGILAEYPVNSLVSFETRLGYISLSGKLNNIDLIGYTAQIGNLPNSTDRVESQYELNANLKAISFEPVLNFLLFGKLRATLGVRAALLVTSTYTESETLISPDYAFFLSDSTRVRGQSSGSIPNSKGLLFATVFGLGFDFPIGKRWTLTPEVRYDLAINDISDVSWSVSSLKFGASARFPLYRPPSPIFINDTLYQRDTVNSSNISITEERIILKETNIKTESKSTFEDDQEYVRITSTVTESYVHEMPKLAELELAVQAFGIDKDAKRSSISSFIIEETEIEENYPLLPQVFFPEGSSDLSQTKMIRMNASQTSAFSESRLKSNTLDVYYQLLNVVGLRMQRSPNAKLSLVGCNDGLSTEKNNRDLSQKRAEAIRDYLINVWQLDPSRFTVKSQNIPASPSNLLTSEGQEENRRVELYATDFDILKPVSIKDITVKANPPVVEVVPTLKSEAGVKNWRAKILQDGNVLRTYKGEDTPAKYTWNVTEEPYPKLERPVSVKYSVTDNSGQTIDAETSLQVQQLTVRQKRYIQQDDKRIDRFSLIVFDFNKADLNPDNKRIVQDVKDRIKPTSTITIAGYADKSGEAEYNRELARRRCVEVQKSVGLNDSNSLIKPIGSDTLLFDNNTPEGRAYSRTVQIVIETPVN